MKDLEMVSQLIQGAFPNYSQLIPQNYSTRSIIDLNEFSRAADLASPFAREGAGIIRLQMIPASDTNKDNIYVTSSAEESGHGEGSIEAHIEGEEAKIAFSSKYLQEVLGVLERGDVALETTNPSSPGVIKQINNEDYVHVIMPMFVQW
jgi:DNA polymerase-3 subunit beta